MLAVEFVGLATVFYQVYNIVSVQNLIWLHSWASCENYTVLEGARLEVSVLEGASMKTAVLKGASMKTAVLEGASMRTAVLEGAS